MINGKEEVDRGNHGDLLLCLKLNAAKFSKNMLLQTNAGSDLFFKKIFTDVCEFLRSGKNVIENLRDSKPKVGGRGGIGVTSY